MKQRIIATSLLIAAIASVPGCLIDEEDDAPTEDECSGVIDFHCGEGDDDDEPTRDPDEECYGWICGLDPDRDR